MSTLRRMSDTASIEHPNWLTSGDFTEADEPLRLFAAWFEEAGAAEPRRSQRDGARDRRRRRPAQCPHGAAQGLRRARLRLLHQPRTAKGAGTGRPIRQAALVFHWKSLNRQVRLRGPVEQVADAEADAYFASRAAPAQIGAWASKQSAPLESRLAFEKAVALATAKLRARRGAAAAVLDRLPRRAADHRVLARPAVPAARPGRVPPRRAGRRLDQDAALSVS